MKISFRLRPKRDDKLKEWITSLPEGKKSKTIRDVLRAYVESQNKEIKTFQQHKKNYNKHTNTNLNDIELNDIEFKEKEIKKEITEKDVDEKIDNLLNNF